MEYLQYYNRILNSLVFAEVLNLVISGIPSILAKIYLAVSEDKVLNLVISGIPSIQSSWSSSILNLLVLNLVISGIPSIHKKGATKGLTQYSFKPCYKWNTFNTEC